MPLDKAAARELIARKLAARHEEGLILEMQEAIVLAAWSGGSGDGPAAIARQLQAVADEMGLSPEDRARLGLTESNVNAVVGPHRAARRRARRSTPGDTTKP